MIELRCCAEIRDEELNSNGILLSRTPQSKANVGEELGSHQDPKGQKIAEEGPFSILYTENLLFNEASLRQKHWQV